MWQRFTERARRVVFFAQEEAGRLGENYVSTEHLLLGLVRENDSVAARILDGMGISLGRIREEIERHVTRGEGRLGQEMQLTPRAKRVIDLAYDEARQLSNNYIGTEHLLLGLIREGEGLAGRVLLKLGVDLEMTRKEVLTLQDNDSGLRPRQPPPSGAGTVSETASGGATPDRRIYPAVRVLVNRIAGGEFAAKPLDAIDGFIDVWRGQSLLGMEGVYAEQIIIALDTAFVIRAMHRARRSDLRFNYPTTMALLFEKSSLRTRTSFEAGMAQLGGSVVYLAPGDVGLGTRESVPDVAGVLSRCVDIIAARVFKHETARELHKHATIPVINALSDREHPLQMFADMLTVRDEFGILDGGIKLSYIGDGNNVLNSLLLTCATLGVNLSAACPPGYMPDEHFVTLAKSIADTTQSVIEIVESPMEAVKEAHVVYTDVWTSMGQEEEAKARRKAFAGYSITMELMAAARPDAIALHCLPAHLGEEIAEDVMEKFRKVIMDQAENRMHTQKALALLMLGV